MLTVDENKVVTFEYTLKNDSGEVLDSSAKTAPLEYLHGSGNIIPGLEAELEGKKVGDKFEASIEAEDAYGLRFEELVQKIERDKLSHLPSIEVGMQLQAYDEDGMQILTVVEVTENEVTLDGNHPLAGEKLHFDVEIIDIREATDEEKEFGLNGGDCGCGDGCGTEESHGCGGGCSGCC
jgi:FKBP-type peptidyl-prolyl cis-trans isomerase SlyD